jgi:hypothetical protein
MTRFYAAPVSARSAATSTNWCRRTSSARKCRRSRRQAAGGRAHPAGWADSSFAARPNSQLQPRGTSQIAALCGELFDRMPVESRIRRGRRRRSSMPPGRCESSHYDGAAALPSAPRMSAPAVRSSERNVQLTNSAYSNHVRGTLCTPLTASDVCIPAAPGSPQGWEPSAAAIGILGG